MVGTSIDNVKGFDWVKQSFNKLRSISTDGESDDHHSTGSDTLSLLKTAIASVEDSRDRESASLPPKSEPYVDRRFNNILKSERDEFFALSISHPILTRPHARPGHLTELGYTYSGDEVVDYFTDQFHSNIILMFRTFSETVEWRYRKTYNTNCSRMICFDAVSDLYVECVWVPEAFNILFPGWGLYTTFTDEQNIYTKTEIINIHLAFDNNISQTTTSILPYHELNVLERGTECITYMETYLRAGGDIDLTTRAKMRRAHPSVLPRSERIMTEVEFQERLEYWAFTKSFLPRTEKETIKEEHRMIHVKFSSQDIDENVYRAKKAGAPWEYTYLGGKNIPYRDINLDLCGLSNYETSYLLNDNLNSLHFRNLCDCWTITRRAIGIYHRYDTELPEYYHVLRLMKQTLIIDVIFITTLAKISSCVLPFIIVNAFRNGEPCTREEVWDALGLSGFDSTFYQAYILKGAQTSYNEFLHNVSLQTAGCMNYVFLPVPRRLFGYHISLYGRGMILPRIEILDRQKNTYGDCLSYTHKCTRSIIPALINMNDFTILPCGYIAGGNSRIVNTHDCILSLFALNIQGCNTCMLNGRSPSIHYSHRDGCLKTNMLQ
uniref:Guanylyltransferase n=1 Tax=Antheraea mylitta cypovirus 4 TaxID=180167 RepID=U3LYB2_9REOV|nr:guanylyltransferase [Antheraea mylitta cypovirus 4]